MHHTNPKTAYFIISANIQKKSFLNETTIIKLHKINIICAANRGKNGNGTLFASRNNNIFDCSVFHSLLFLQREDTKKIINTRTREREKQTINIKNTPTTSYLSTNIVFKYSRNASL